METGDCEITRVSVLFTKLAYAWPSQLQLRSTDAIYGNLTRNNLLIHSGYESKNHLPVITTLIGPNKYKLVNELG